MPLAFTGGGDIPALPGAGRGAAHCTSSAYWEDGLSRGRSVCCALWRASFSINNLFRRIINRPLEETPHIIGAQQESSPASLPQVGTVSVVVMECMATRTDCRE